MMQTKKMRKQMSKYEQRHQRVGRKWEKLKHLANCCPDCGYYGAVGLNDRYMAWFNRFSLECEDCHYCTARANTIRGAIRKWNRDHGKYSA